MRCYTLMLVVSLLVGSVCEGWATSSQPGGNISVADLTFRKIGSQIGEEDFPPPTLGSYFAPPGPYDYWGPANAWRGHSTMPFCFSTRSTQNVTCTESWIGIDVLMDIGTNRIWHGYDINSRWTGSPPGDASNRRFTDDRKMVWYGAPMLDLSFGDTGFHANVQGYWHSGEWSDRNSLNYMLYWDYYFANLFQLRFGYTYYDFLHRKDDWKDFHEVFAGFVLHNFPLRPSYHFFHDWFGSSFGGSRAGNFHVFGLSEAFALPVPMLLSCYQEFTFSGDIWYNDGWNGADSDWSHATLGVETDLPLGCGSTLTPGLYYQISMEDSVNPHDEFWFRMTLYLPVTTARPF